MNTQIRADEITQAIANLQIKTGQHDRENPPNYYVETLWELVGEEGLKQIAEAVINTRAEPNAGLVEELDYYRRQAHYAKEVYHQMDRIIPETAPEASLLRVIDEMYCELKDLRLEVLTKGASNG